MPFMTNGKRDYQKEKAWDHKHKNGKRLKDRAQRNAARAEVAKSKGTSPTKLKGDVGHRRAVGKGGTNSLSNLFVQNPTANRSFSRNADGSMKSEISKKERKKK